MPTPAPALLQLVRQLDAAAPRRSRQMDGIMRSPSIGPPSDHHVGNALDVTHDPAGGCDAGVLALELVRQMRQAPVTGRLTYVIWDHHIYSGRTGWLPRKYTRSCPHVRHAHLSLKGTHRDVVRPWSLRLR